MITGFFPLLSRLSRDPESAWSLWRFLSDFSDALWEMHQDDFLQRFSETLQDEEWPDPGDPGPEAENPCRKVHPMNPWRQEPQNADEDDDDSDGEGIPVRSSSPRMEPDSVPSDILLASDDDDVPF